MKGDGQTDSGFVEQNLVMFTQQVATVTMSAGLTLSQSEVISLCKKFTYSELEPNPLSEAEPCSSS